MPIVKENTEFLADLHIHRKRDQILGLNTLHRKRGLGRTRYVNYGLSTGPSGLSTGFPRGDMFSPIGIDTREICGITCVYCYIMLPPGSPRGKIHPRMVLTGPVDESNVHVVGRETGPVYHVHGEYGIDEESKGLKPQ